VGDGVIPREGYQRSRTEMMRPPRPDSGSSDLDDMEDDEDDRRSDHQAATRIQAMFRGYRERKSLGRLFDPNISNALDESVAEDVRDRTQVSQAARIQRQIHSFCFLPYSLTPHPAQHAWSIISVSLVSFSENNVRSTHFFVLGVWDIYNGGGTWLINKLGLDVCGVFAVHKCVCVVVCCVCVCVRVCLW
jgi:hypothetical protein